MKPFNVFSKELLEGVNLIEASAGTGKTYSITTLILRLLIERQLKLEQILSVSFTEAAAKELRDRIRSRLVAAKKYLQDPQSIVDSDFVTLFSTTSPDIAESLLDEALREIDVAPIYTIHGFCQHMLQDYAFETGQSFGTTLVTDSAEFVQELAEDFWRIIIQKYPHEYFRGGGLGVGVFVEMAKVLMVPGVGLNAPQSTFCPTQFDASKKEFSRAISWFYDPENQVEIDQAETLLLEARAQGVLKNKPAKAKNIEDWFAALNTFFKQSNKELGSPALLGKDWVNELSQEKLNKNTRKGSVPPKHFLFDQLELVRKTGEVLGEKVKQFDLMLVHEFYEWIQKEAMRRKQAMDIQFFDDLLQRVYDTVQADPDGRFCQLIRTRFPAVLIDEFQDTDLIQWGIFGTIYDPCKLDPHKHSLLLIGDPKQSIYSFRNADIDVYLRAKKSAGKNLWSMTTNYRSEPGVIAALNHWAALVGNNHCFDLPGDIDYEPVVPHPNWTLDDQMVFPEGDTSLMLMINSENQKKRETSQSAQDDTVDAIQYVLANNRLKEDPLKPGDLAVLVNTNAQASSMHQKLRARRIPSVVVTRESVFKSVVAQALYHLLCAVLSPRDEKLLRGVLLTELFTKTAADVMAIGDDEWVKWIQTAHDWRSLWEQEGISAFLTAAEGTASLSMNLMEQAGLGERAVTDLRHLTEQLSSQELEQQASPHHLLRWFEQKMAGAKSDSDEDLVRLESDADRVQVVTVHCSKGLEYPVVFCPFLWEGRSSMSAQSQIYSDGRIKVFDYANDHKESIRENNAREALRKQYVALTRAKHQLWVYAAKGGTHNHNPPLHHWGLITTPSNELLCSEYITTVNRDRIREAPVYRPPQDESLKTVVPPLIRSVRENWLLHSYSSLAGHGDASSHADHDEIALPSVVEEVEPEGVFALPKGATFGLQVHELFETIDFQINSNGRKAAANQMCERAGYDPKCGPDLLELISQTLDSPLAPESFCLAEIAQNKRLVEMDFHFPIHSIQRSELARITNSAVQHPKDPCQGFMKGFIDLIFEQDGKFWIADYKTNYLGSKVADYAFEPLSIAMAAQGYILQLHLYTLALHRYLRLKKPNYDYNKHIGGAFYLFVRGMDSNGNGVYFKKVPCETVEAMDRLFAGEA